MLACPGLRTSQAIVHRPSSNVQQTRNDFMDRILTTDFTRPFLDQLLDHVDREYLAKGVPLERLAFVFGG